MNMNGNELDHLTRMLFKSSTLEPSPDLSRRIMAQIAKEKSLQESPAVKVYMKSWKLSPWAIIAIALYFLLAICLLYILLNMDAGKAEEITRFFILVKDKLPFILTIFAVFASFPFFTTIDRALS